MNSEPFRCPACKHVSCLTGECQCDCDPVYEMHCRINAAVEECEDIERNWRAYEDTSGAEIAERIREKLEGR